MKSATYQTTAIVLLLLLTILPGCGYPEVSPTTYEIAGALYSVSNLKREDGLANVETLISESLQAQEISSREAGYLIEIVQQCRAGDWETAQAECRRMMDDQIDR